MSAPSAPAAGVAVSGGRRLAPREGEVIDRGAPLRFRWDGREHSGYRGDTIVSALLAGGVTVFSRSFKYHRPRGVLSASFVDPGCTLQVGDEPNVRGGHRRVEPGMNVRPQNVWPSLRFDAKSANQLVGRFLGAGFYYKTFIKPERLWPAYEQVLKRFATGGKVSPQTPHGVYDKRYAHPDVLVAGGGPAGMAAALGAAEAGAAVMLVEEDYDLGGHLRWGDASQRALAAELVAAVNAEAGIEVLTNSVVTGRYDDNWVAVCQRRHPDRVGGGFGPAGSPVIERLVKARAGGLVVAAGLIERPYVFEGNDRPGVMLSSAARRLVKLWAVRPGSRAVVLTANPEGDAAAEDLASAGVEVARVLDARSGGDVVRALGARDGSLAAVELGDGTRVACDLLVTAVGWSAPTSLLNMSGDRPVYEPRAARFLPGGRLPAGVYVTGGLAGDASAERLVEHGRAVGAAAARGEDPAGVEALGVDEHPEIFRGRTHGMVDFSEDVSSKDLVAAAGEGYDSIELMKRYTTVTMGPSQGKLETVNAVAVLSEATGRSIAETGTTVWRPPYAPISLGALAGRIHEPVRYSPMQPWHEAHGARPLVAGQWIRPEHYGDPEAEVASVRSGVGIIDVTPLGKLDLRGPDVPELLNLLYVNKWSKLAVGSVRYGVMCADDGVVLDDGVTGRLCEDQWLMSTTSSGAATVWEWAEAWLQTEHPGWRVQVTPVTTAYASINIAGPASRELLGRLCTDVELSGEAFPYMHLRAGTVAGVEGCWMWRIGFTGELSYELHVPAGYGLHVWESLLAAGGDLGVGPFGIEAQRIMRLEKGHFIVGQDTDGLTKALGAGLDWLVKVDKEDFVGKPEIAWQAGERYQRLVGLQPLDGDVVPPEASQIVQGERRIVGRITSSRRSPTLGRSICLGFVEPELAGAGTVVTVLAPDGRRVPARVMEHHAHYDPEGVRLRG